MSKFNIVRKCYNCGEVLQNTDKTKPGYISSEISSLSQRFLFCDECYKKDSYDIVPNNVEIDDAFKIMLMDAKASDALILYVLDLFSFEASFSKKVTKMISGLNTLVVATKRDLFKNEVNDDVLIDDVNHRLRRENLKVKDVILTSSLSQFNVKELLDKIELYRNGHDVYIIGALGAGKTYLTNSLLKNFKNKSRRAIKTQEYPGTNMSILQIPLDKNSTLYDSEGLNVTNSILNFVEPEIHKLIIPLKPIKHETYKVNKDSIILIGGLAFFEFVDCDSFIIHCYFSKDVETKKIPLKKKGSIIDKIILKKKISPTSKNIKSLSDFNTYEINVNEIESRDIGIQGLGWISFYGNKQIVRISVPKGVGIYHCRAKIPHVD